MMPQQPENYGRDILVTVARDPSTLFLYWELGGIADPATSDWAVRLENIDTGAVSLSMIDPAAGSWYLSALPGKTYRAELGTVSDGEFTPYLQSETVRTPRLSYSTIGDVSWMISEKALFELQALGGELFSGGSRFTATGDDTEAPWVTILYGDAISEPFAEKAESE
jgi:hypothetical protein